MFMIHPFRPIVACALFLAIGALWGVAAAADRYVGGMEGIPLMAGLTEVAEERVEVDSPAGRIVQALATGGVSKAEVLKFYTETLLQHGWRAEGAGVFCHEEQTLAIELEESVSPGITVLFSLFPNAETKTR